MFACFVCSFMPRNVQSFCWLFLNNKSSDKWMNQSLAPFADDWVMLRPFFKSFLSLRYLETIPSPEQVQTVRQWQRQIITTLQLGPNSRQNRQRSWPGMPSQLTQKRDVPTGNPNWNGPGKSKQKLSPNILYPYRTMSKKKPKKEATNYYSNLNLVADQRELEQLSHSFHRIRYSCPALPPSCWTSWPG